VVSRRLFDRSLSIKTPFDNEGQFGVALNEDHFHDLLFELIPPPAQQTPSVTSSGPTLRGASADLMMMGFPTRLPDTSAPSLCVCHSDIKSEGFLCPRCLAKVCDVPTDCDICGLMIVSSPHLARSYHHLFPVRVYEAVLSLDQVPENAPKTCHGCTRTFLTAPSTTETGDGLSPLGRYRCPGCKNDFCSDCDVFVHEVMHCCPGCGG